MLFTSCSTTRPGNQPRLEQTALIMLRDNTDYIVIHAADNMLRAYVAHYILGLRSEPISLTILP